MIFFFSKKQEEISAVCDIFLKEFEATDSAIASIIYGEPAAAVDGNVLRVTARLLDDPRDVMLSSTRKVMTALLNSVIPADFPGDFNEVMTRFIEENRSR